MKRSVLMVMVLLHILSSAANAARFVDNGDETVTHNTTGLIWQKGEGGQKNWESALTYCETQSLAGKDDWRLPNVKELESLTDDSLYNPVIDKSYFPNAYSSSYWSSTTSAVNTTSAWDVAFSNGYVGYGNKANGNYVRCVRGGQ